MDEGLLGDYCDGSIFKSHPLFSADSKALQIVLYYDDVEVVNPIGSRTKTHKLGTIVRHCVDYWPYFALLSITHARNDSKLWFLHHPK